MAALPEGHASRPADDSGPGAAPGVQGDAGRPRPGAFAEARAWLDSLVVVVVLGLFVRVFFVEMFKIPSGSMTPTLIGGQIAWLDYNGDGKPDLLALDAADRPLLFVDEGDALRPRGAVNLSVEERRRLESEGSVQFRNDRILVNKMAYWFCDPRRGDIIVFEAPSAVWAPGKDAFVKRCVGLPGETIGFDAEGGLVADGAVVTDPSFFGRQRYQSLVGDAPVQAPGGVIEYEPGADWAGRRRVRQMHVPYGQVLAFGDNADSSLDSRYWGGVPVENIKGRAFFRCYPPSQMKFLSGQ